MMTPAPAQSRFIPLPGFTCHFREYPASGPNILLLHGLGSSSFSWEETAPRLQAAGYRTFALDLKGSGWSDKPAGAAYDPWTLMEEIVLWLESMGLPPVCLAGNSLGGSLGLLLALEHPERISRLILIAAAAYTDRLPWIFRLAHLPFSRKIAGLLFRKGLIRLAMKQAFVHQDRVTPERVEAYYQRLRSPGCLEAQINLVRSLDFQALSRFDQRIPTIRIPTLLIWGEQDPWIPLSVGRRLKMDLPDAALQIIPRCGHAPQEELPGETAGLIIRWLNEGGRVNP